MSGGRVMAAVAAGAVLYGGVAAAPAAADGGERRVTVFVTDSGSRPGELFSVNVRGLGRPDARQEATASSPAFAGPVRLTAYWMDLEKEYSFQAKPAIAESARPGSHPLLVAVGGRTVAKATVRVAPAKRPEFSVSASPGRAQRPGETLAVSYDDLYPGETGHTFTVRSEAFDGPASLTHDPDGSDWNNPRLFSALPAISRQAKDGVYTVTLSGPSGQVLERRPITVRAARSGDADYLGKARGPLFFGLSGSPEDAANHYRTKPGGTFNVLWTDASPDPGEETALTATSPAFQRPVRLKRDDSKAADGSDPRYYATARVRPDLDPGSYPVTVVSHHQRVKRTGQVVVTGERKAAPETEGPGRPALLAGVGGAAVAAGTGFVLWRRRAARRAGNV
ncbi:hypothetical protein ACH4OW_09020 [Streptomyces sp. NPDC017056]|uniref:hypothetical protein n=1 Tax=Streptomyces sp. NPDC017056 TaxID=3364973 RepID=UPI0037BAD1CD